MRILLAWLNALRPGLIVAAAGIGAGDVVTATVTGAEFGTALAWALAVCVVLKFVLTEGLAHWQLATGTTIAQAYTQRLPGWVRLYFLVYLWLWTFLVGGSLTNACGLAGHSIFPQLPIWGWGIIHSAVAVALVWSGRFAFFEHLMKLLVGVMVVLIASCAVWLQPDPRLLLEHLFWPGLPEGGGRAVLSILGGIGGSMTLLCYGYWIQENGWNRLDHQPAIRADLRIAYAVTFVFALALTIVASQCNATVTQGNGIVLEVASRLKLSVGLAGQWAFLIGFWCAVFTSLLGVWQGVPYLYADLVTSRAGGKVNAAELKKTWAYRGYLLFLAGPPLVLLFIERPVAIVTVFTLVGAFFMPLLAAILLYLNYFARREGEVDSGWLRNSLLLWALVIFSGIAVSEIVGALFG
jgi:Mn2+/Fe2+ NRAMP family transporter